MKKVLIAVVACMAMGFASCGNKTQAPAEAADSTVVAEQSVDEAVSAITAALTEQIEAKDANKLQETLASVQEQVKEFVTKNPELANMFNLPVYTNRIGATERTSNLTTSQQISCYTVDPEGNIDFPQLGKIHVTGMQRQEIATLIKAKLIETQLVLDPIVTVEFANLYFSILGEVTHPGRFTIDQDKISILDHRFP